ncbi:hypothetical protein Leryth_006526 [Lithospermum erythrorhizon]|nr:hypothetical protein Leryth_006526 [Lithospermum erythrorhizon]
MDHPRLGQEGPGFSEFFERLKTRGILSNGSKELCVGARVGHEVAALKLVGVSDSVGIAVGFMHNRLMMILSISSSQMCLIMHFILGSLSARSNGH